MGSEVIFRGQWFAVVVCVLALPVHADAHRLDEYLQAARISVDANRVRVEMDLSPGVDVAGGIVRSIDVNGDGRIDDHEADAYAATVLRALTLSLDGRPVPLRLDHHTFATPVEMLEGLGTNRIVASASIASAVGHHRLSLANGYLPGISAYLMNALVPADPRMMITAQRRDPRQRTYTLDYNVSGNRTWIGWSGTAMAMVGLLIIGRMRKWRT